MANQLDLGGCKNYTHTWLLEDNIPTQEWAIAEALSHYDLRDDQDEDGDDNKGLPMGCVDTRLTGSTDVLHAKDSTDSEEST